jgi:ferredoxin
MLSIAYNGNMPPDQATRIALLFIGAGWLVAFGWLGWTSYQEMERRATRVAWLLALSGGAFFLLAALLPPAARLILLGFILLSAVALVGLFFLPLGKIPAGKNTPQRRFDERDIMFARARLKPGSPQYRAYYAMRPENQESDERTRSRPGLLSPQAHLADPCQFAAAVGSFGLTDALRDAVDGPVAAQHYDLPPKKMTRYLKDLALYYGALDVGVTELRPYHVYSHIGRGSGVYGAPLDVEHRYAIAFTVEMDFSMVGAAAYPPITMESARQYVEAARIAVPLAGAIRALGYPARAHIDGNYRVIAPLVARDAGLGEIGRMGLLMTPRHGPRVRLGVVTTDAEMLPDGYRFQEAVIDFCTRCKKCAVNCPGQSIPFADRQEIDGALRWRINSDACFHYWNLMGTDCGRCMAVCPYAHPATPVHNLVRRGIAHSGAFRRAANWMDDLFYGKKPARRAAPGWTKVR